MDRASKNASKELATSHSASFVATKSDVNRARQQLSPVLSHALDWIMSYLVVHKNEILLTKGNLESKVIRTQNQVIEDVSTPDTGLSGAAAKMPDVWHKTYSTCKSIPKYYQTHWLTQGPPQLSNGIIDLVDAADPAQGIRKVFAFFSGLRENTWWPPVLHTRVLLTLWLAEQYVAIGGVMRREAFLEAYSPEDNLVAWDVLFPFTIDWGQRCDR